MKISVMSALAIAVALQAVPAAAETDQLNAVIAGHIGNVDVSTLNVSQIVQIKAFLDSTDNQEDISRFIKAVVD